MKLRNICPHLPSPMIMLTPGTCFLRLKNRAISRLSKSKLRWMIKIVNVCLLKFSDNNGCYCFDNFFKPDYESVVEILIIRSDLRVLSTKHLLIQILDLETY